MISVVCYISVLLAFIHSGESLHCYNCVSKNNPKCFDPLANGLKPTFCDPKRINELAKQAGDIYKQLANAFGVDHEPTVNEEPFLTNAVCQKSVTYVGNEVMVIRSCAVTSNKEAHCTDFKKQAGNELIKECSICDTDGCNSGNNLAPLSILSLIFATILTSFWTIFTF